MVSEYERHVLRLLVGILATNESILSVVTPKGPIMDRVQKQLLHVNGFIKDAEKFLEDEAKE